MISHLHHQLARARADELAHQAAAQHLITDRGRHRAKLPARWPFVLVAGMVGLALSASAAPSPLYADYAARWHFSTPVLTVVFATYALGALGGLLLVGRLSDDLGRRPLLAAGLAGLLAAMVLFACARSVKWLLAARLVQGVATGTILSAAGAALLEFEPGRDVARAGLVNGVSASLGIGTGALLTSLLVQDAPDPRVIPFALLGVLFAIALGGVRLLPETVVRKARPALRPQRPELPAEGRGAFALASAGVVASWSIAGLYLALAPSLAVILLRTQSHLAGGVSVFALGASAAVGQIALRRLTPSQATAAGSLALAVGMAGGVVSIPTDSGALFLAGSVITGAGWGVAFMGALRSISATAPARHLAGVIAALYLVAYLALSIPSVIAGLAVPDLGIEPTFRIFGIAVILLALITAVGTRRRPPATRTVQPGVRIRYARPEDDAALADLAALDSSAVPAPPLLVAELDGELRAALSLATGQVIANPFHMTATLLDRLRERAAPLARSARHTRRSATLPSPLDTRYEQA